MFQRWINRRQAEPGIDFEWPVYQRPCLIALIGEYNTTRYAEPTAVEAFCALLEGRKPEPACRTLPKQLPHRTMPTPRPGDVLVFRKPDDALIGVFPPNSSWATFPTGELVINADMNDRPPVKFPAGGWGYVRRG